MPSSSSIIWMHLPRNRFSDRKRGWCYYHGSTKRGKGRKALHLRGVRRGRGRHIKGGRPRQIRGFIEPALLLLLHKGATHGYDLIEGLNGIGFESYPVDSSTVYRALRHLERHGTVVSDWDRESSFGPPRRVYRLTPEGEEYLNEWVTDLRATAETLKLFLQAYDEEVEGRDT